MLVLRFIPPPISSEAELENTSLPVIRRSSKLLANEKSEMQMLHEGATSLETHCTEIHIDRMTIYYLPNHIHRMPG